MIKKYTRFEFDKDKVVFDMTKYIGRLVILLFTSSLSLFYNGERFTTIYKKAYYQF